VDKEGVEMWVPISGEIRSAILTLLDRNPVAERRLFFPARGDRTNHGAVARRALQEREDRAPDLA